MGNLCHYQWQRFPYHGINGFHNAKGAKMMLKSITSKVRNVFASVARKTSTHKPLNETMMLKHADGTPYMHVADYYASRSNSFAPEPIAYLDKLIIDTAQKISDGTKS